MPSTLSERLRRLSPTRRDPEEVVRLRRRVNRLSVRLEATEASLRARMDELEQGLQEQRGLGNRVAELSDLVVELISAAASADSEPFEAALDRYAREI